MLLSVRRKLHPHNHFFSCSTVDEEAGSRVFFSWICAVGELRQFFVWCAQDGKLLCYHNELFFGWIEFCWQLKTRELLLCLFNDFHQALTENQSFRESELNSSFYFPPFHFATQSSLSRCSTCFQAHDNQL